MKGPYSFVPRGTRLAGEFDPRKILADADFEVRKGLVVFEFLVEAGLHVLDQAGFKQQRVDLALGLDEIDRANFGDEVGRADILRGGRVEIAADPAPQIDRLADVDHAAPARPSSNTRRRSSATAESLRGNRSLLIRSSGFCFRRRLPHLTPWAGSPSPPNRILCVGQPSARGMPGGCRFRVLVFLSSQQVPTSPFVPNLPPKGQKLPPKHP